MADSSAVDIVATVFKSLAHPVRLTAVEFLRSGPRCVCEIVPAMGVDQSTASRHLTALKRAGLVNSHREGTRVIYCLRDDYAVRMVDVALAAARVNAHWSRCVLVDYQQTINQLKEGDCRDRAANQNNNL